MWGHLLWSAPAADPQFLSHKDGPLQSLLKAKEVCHELISSSQDTTLWLASTEPKGSSVLEMPGGEEHQESYSDLVSGEAYLLLSCYYE